jgi:hypothetical protein
LIVGDFRKWPEDTWLFSEQLAGHLDYLYALSFENIEDGVYPVKEDGTKKTSTTPFAEMRPERL